MNIATSSNNKVSPFITANIAEKMQKTLSSFDSSTGSMPLNDGEIVFIKQMMVESPKSFIKITDKINDILTDRKIQPSDIPILLHIITTIYLEDFDCDNIDILACVKFTLDTILDSGLLPINGAEASIIKNVVDSSIGLLKINLPIVEKEVELICGNWRGFLCCCGGGENHK
jgi:hypothetical protein